LESYESESRDIGLVSIKMPEPIFAARLAPVGYSVREGDAVASVGCDHGADPTVRKDHQIKRITQTNLWVNDAPVSGRSGGGLFSAEGYIVGIAKGHDESGQEGCFPNLSQICAQLDLAKLSFVYQSPQGWEKPAAGIPATLQAGNVPTMPSDMPGFNTPRNPPAVGIPDGNLPINPTVTPASFAMGNSPNLSASDQAALDELRRNLKDGAEIVCVIRPRNAPGAKSEIITIDKASPELVRQISLESQGKDGVRRTSLEVARPRKKLLEWSITGNPPQTAP
jgi:hypothetical protein